MAVAVVRVLDAEVRAGAAAQPHDLIHRCDVLWADLHAGEAMGAVVDAVRILGEIPEPGLLLAVARVADEAVGLGQRGGADEVGVDLHGETGRDAHSAMDAGHGLGDVEHRLRRDGVLLPLGRVLGGQQPGYDPLDLLPVDGLHVHDQVLDHGHVAHRLPPDPAVTRSRGGVADLGVAGQARAAIDAHAARAADGGAAGAADPDRGVLAVLHLEDAVEHGALGRKLGGVVGPVGGLARLGVVAPDLQLIVGHLNNCVPRAATG